MRLKIRRTLSRRRPSKRPNGFAISEAFILNLAGAPVIRSVRLLLNAYGRLVEVFHSLIGEEHLEALLHWVADDVDDLAEAGAGPEMIRAIKSNYRGSLKLLAVSPASGPVAGGTKLRVSGSGIKQGARLWLQSFNNGTRLDTEVGRLRSWPSGRFFVVVNGAKGEGFDSVGRPAFIANGKQVSFGARRGREFFRQVAEMP